LNSASAGTLLALLLMAWVATAQSPSSPTRGSVEFYLTGDEYSGVVSIDERLAAQDDRLGVIGGMRSHSLDIDVTPGPHRYLISMFDKTNAREVSLVVQTGMLHRVRIDLHAVRSESSGVLSPKTTTYYDATITVELPVPRPPETKFEDLPRSAQISLMLFAGLGLPIVWILPIVLGIRAARRKGISPHWMWFGVHPLGGWLAFLILRFGARPRF
jgi:hypothetical protein